MDNQKSYCPRYLDNSKELAGTERLPTKIYGGIIWSGKYEEKRNIVFFLNHDHFGKEKSYNLVAKTYYFFYRKWKRYGGFHSPFFTQEVSG